MKHVNFYQVLGVNPKASQDDLKKAYHKLAREFHPDVAANKALAEEKFKAINEAYEVLSDPQKRSDYEIGRLKGFCPEAKPGTYTKRPERPRPPTPPKPRPTAEFKEFKWKAKRRSKALKRGFTILVVVLIFIIEREAYLRMKSQVAQVMGASYSTEPGTVSGYPSRSPMPRANNNDQTALSQAGDAAKELIDHTRAAFEPKILKLQGISMGAVKLATINNTVLGEGETGTVNLGHPVQITCQQITNNAVLITIVQSHQQQWLYKN
jgi:hypothetical protein